MSHAQWVAGMAALLDALYERHGLRPLFIPQCTYSGGGPLEDDRNVATEVAEAMRGRADPVVVRERLNVEECLSLYAGARVALCTRLHGAVFAAMNATPVLAFGYHPKVAGFMDWLGQSDRVVSLRRGGAADWLDKAEAALGASLEERGRVLARIEEGRREVEQYGAFAAALLTGERLPAPATGRGMP
jgi:polysaccharide pyruvyl transferase WcaK-like protein